MIRIILHLSVLVIIQHSNKPFQRVRTLFLSNFVEIPIELYSSIYFRILFSHSFYRRNQLYLMDNGRPSLDNIGYRLLGALLLQYKKSTITVPRVWAVIQKGNCVYGKKQ